MNLAETREIVTFPCFFRAENSGHEFRWSFLGLPEDGHGPGVQRSQPSNGPKTPAILVSPDHSFALLCLRKRTSPLLTSPISPTNSAEDPENT